MHRINGALLALLITSLLQGAPRSTGAAELYVAEYGLDSNPGTSASPLRSIGAASQYAQPGTTVHVAQGTYAGGIKTTTSGTMALPIRYVSTPKWAARIVPPENSTSEAGWDNRGAFVIIDGFEVDGRQYNGGTRWSEGIYTSGSGSTVTNTHVHDLAANIPCSSHGGGGILGDSYYLGTDIDLIGNIVHDVGPPLCRFIHGLYQTASGRVVNNLVYRISGWGIHLWHDANHVMVANNTVFNSAEGGILVGGGDFVHSRGPADYITVANNIVFDNAKYGIAEWGRTGDHNIFTHNLSYKNGANWRLLTSNADPSPISADPRFAAYVRTGGGDYHLAPGSPAIDAGARLYAPTSDLDGAARQHGTRVDIGAYAFVAFGDRQKDQ
jgi:hypothetical protein